MTPTAEIAVAETLNEPMETTGQALTSEPDSHDKIAALAYEFWIQRGSPVGSPEDDWFRAEEEIKNRKANAQTGAA